MTFEEWQTTDHRETISVPLANDFDESISKAAESGACASCGRGEDQPHTGDCLVALEQDALDGDPEARAALAAEGRLDDVWARESGAETLVPLMNAFGALPIFTPKESDRIIDSGTASLSAWSGRTIQIVGRLDSGSVVGRDGGAYVAVRPDAFAAVPEKGQNMVVSFDEGQNRVVAFDLPRENSRER